MNFSLLSSFRGIGIFLLLLLLTSDMFAQWSNDPTVNTPIVTATGTQNNQVSVTDGNKGIITAWVDNRNGQSEIYIQKLNGSGVAQWTANGVRLTNTASTPGGLVIAPDNAGGAVVAWHENRSTHNDIYVQRIDASGTALWTADGLNITLEPNFNNQSGPYIYADANDIVVSWTDQREGGANGREVGIWAQKLNWSGVEQWTQYGIKIVNNPQAENNSKIVSDGAGGFWFVFDDESNGYAYRVTAQKTNGSGVLQFGAAGILAGNYTGNNAFLKDAIADGAGGVIMVWDETRTQQEIYAQRLDGSGTKLWGNNGIAVSAGVLLEQPVLPLLVPDGASGAIIGYRNYSNNTFLGSIYAQRIDAAGSKPWSAGGTLLSVGPDNHNTPVITTDGAGGAIVGWLVANALNIYAQRVDNNGNALWTAGGIGISTNVSTQTAPLNIISDQAGGAIINWSDLRNSNQDIYAQQVNGSGSLGTGSIAPDAPVLSSPADNSTAQSRTPSLTWNSVSGATGYRLQLASDNGFSTILKDTVVSGTTYAVWSPLSSYSNYYWKVKTFTASDSSNFSSAFTFRTVLAVPTLSTPANGSIFASRTPTISWNAVSGATTYDLQVATDNAFATVIESSTGETGTSYALTTTLDYYTVYYWRVRASDGSETTAYSTGFSFRTLITTPVLSSPADNAIVQPVLTVFDWDDVTGATSYRLQIATDAGFTNVVQNITGIGTSGRTLTTPLAYYTNYFWRVSAFDGPNETVFSTSRTLRTEIDQPNLVSPGHLSPGNPIHPTLVWNTVLGADQYRMQFSADPGFGTLMYDSVMTDTTMYIDSILENNTLYYWRVYAENADPDVSPWSSRTFRTVLEVIPYLTFPIANVTVNSLSPTLYWNINVSSTGITYDVLYSVDSMFPPGLTTIVNAGANIEYQISGLTPATQYFWRVRSKNVNGVIKYSVKESFTTFGEVSSLPIQSYPIGGATVFTNNPTLYWYFPYNSFGYTYEVRYKASASGSWEDTVNVGGSLSYTWNGLSGGTSYDWQVRSNNGVVYSDWTGTATFVTAVSNSGTPQTPIVSYPFGGVTIYSLTPTLYWYLGTSLGSGLTYEIELRTDNSFTGVPGITGVADMYYTVSTLLPGTTYYFKVRSYNGSTYSNWSDEASFVTFGATGDIFPYLSYPIGGQIVYTNSVNLNWYMVGSAASVFYELQIKAGDSSFTTSIPGLSTTSFTANALIPGTTYFWRVRANNGNANSAYTFVESFTVSGNVGSLVPILSWPIGGAATGTTVDLYWYMNGSAPSISYQVVYASESDFSNQVTVNTANQTTQLTGLVPGVIYYWKVRTFNGTAYSAFTPTETFVTNAGAAPVRPLGGSPVASVALNTNSAEFSWFLPTASTVALTYELQYSVTPDFMNPVTISDISSRSYIASTLPGGAPLYWRVRSKTAAGNYSAYSRVERFTPATPTAAGENEVPTEFALGQNYPNPFNPSTVISFALPVESHVTVRIYDMLGTEVKTLVNEVKSAGVYSMQWAGDNNAGNIVSAGTYLYRITAGEFTQTKKMVFLK